MTVSEMITNLRLGLDKTSSLTTPSFEPEELVHWLNVAQQRWVKTKFSGNNIYKAGFGDMQKRISDLQNLVVNLEDVLPATQYQDYPIDQVYVLDLENVGVFAGPPPVYIDITDWVSEGKFMFFLDSRTNITRSEKYDVYSPSTTGVVKNIYVDAEDIGKYLETPHNKPYFEQPICFLEGNNLVVITDSYCSVNSIYIKYLREPRVLVLSVSNVAKETTTCELPEYACQEIVDLAVTILLENIESQRIQTQPVIAANNE